MERRTFLASAMLAGMTARADARRVRIGFMGGTYSHTSGKVEVIQQSPDFELVGMWPDSDEVAKRYGARGVRMLEAEKLLGSPDVDVIAVQSDVPDHALHGMMVLEAGKHLHLEKPPALDVSSFRSLMDTAARKHLIVQQGFMWRHHPGFRAIFEAVRNGWLGEVHFVQGTINKVLEAERRPEWARFRGGQMFELCSHLIDQTIRLMGRPNRISPFLKKHGNFKDDFVDNTLAVFEYSNAIAIVAGNALQPNSGRYRGFTVQGTLGTATLLPIEPARLEIDLAQAAGPYKKGVQVVELPPYKRFVDDFKELASAVRGEKPIGVSFAEDIIVHEALMEASGM